MRLLQIAARPMLGSLFLSSGIDTLRNPEPRADLAKGTLEQLRGYLPFLPDDDVLLVRANAAVQLLAGASLSVGRLPRVSALVLAASLVPTTYAGHAWWQHDEAEARSGHRTQFGKNAAVLGGLLAVAGTPRHTHRHTAHGGGAAHCPWHHGAGGRSRSTVRLPSGGPRASQGGPSGAGRTNTLAAKAGLLKNRCGRLKGRARGRGGSVRSSR
ncbi:DoxX family protein [Streptomyces xiaopingdaonensis]|uniref:DoxX family protein n=1 Tax=Streptomyces xiaopingdaonensis TaxID=1565415 RepID=UPI000301ED76|nr:DoxX family protein [Streptomyces xiaopingdaonensis]